jgi:hypothetical protein
MKSANGMMVDQSLPAVRESNRQQRRTFGYECEKLAATNINVNLLS